MQDKAHIGLYGLAVMGQNLVLNMNDHGFKVAVYNRTVSKVDDFLKGPAKGRDTIFGAHSLEEFIGSLERPRKIMLMIKAGKAIDDFIETLIPHLEEGDLIIDGGNSHFPDTIRRTKYLAERNLLYIGTGVSGGEEGARRGPSLMPGGNPKAWPLVKEIFQAIAAKTDDGTPCCDWVGEDGAGHYVKMTHNGIEYGDMQLICEAYQLMKNALNMSPDQMHEVFAEWNEGELDSYLIEITADILKFKDEDGNPLVEKILDTAGQKGTGKWTGISSLELGIPVTLIGEAVYARCLSALKEERVQASKKLHGPKVAFTGNSTQFIEDIRNALLASKIISYAQGFMLMREAAAEYGWNLNYGGIALMWRGGCIIRSAFLGKIKDAFDTTPDLHNLLLDDYFQQVIERCQASWRRVVSKAFEMGVPIPAFSTALSFYDGYRSERLPANLLQAQRDYFGAHTHTSGWMPPGEVFFIPTGPAREGMFQQVPIQYNSNVLPDDMQLSRQQPGGFRRPSGTGAPLWRNPRHNNGTFQAEEFPDLDKKAVANAEERLRRFAPLLAEIFPESFQIIQEDIPESVPGTIESPLQDIASLRYPWKKLTGKEISGRLFMKRDDLLPIAGSVKARGGIYEVLWYAESLARKAGILTADTEDYRVLGTDKARSLFSSHRITVGSTGNLGLSIGITARGLGINVRVHMSEDAKQWKKDLLRSRGAEVIEHSGDYAQAVAAGRRESAGDDACHFIDDENSRQLFLGYAAAGKRLFAQLQHRQVPVNREHPLFIYLPCGVGGAPGGISLGLSYAFGPEIPLFIFVAEPVEMPAAGAGILSGRLSGISVRELGLGKSTEADGLAVGQLSQVAGPVLARLAAGGYTVNDEELFMQTALLKKYHGAVIEPSASASMGGPFRICGGTVYPRMENATHIMWSTGGSLLPPKTASRILEKGNTLLTQTGRGV